MPATGRRADDEGERKGEGEREWVARVADALLSERRPEHPDSRRRASLARVMVALRAGRGDIPEPSEAFRARVEDLVREASEGAAEPERAGEARPARSGPGGVTRRELLRWAGAAAVLATAASVGADWLLDRLGAERRGRHAGAWREVALSADLGEGGVVFREAEGTSLFLVRQGGRVRALSAVCTHMPCLLHADPARGELVCPCHGARFDLQGRFLPSAYRQPLPSLPEFAVREDGGRIYVWVG